VKECHYQLAFLEEITCTKTRKRCKSGGTDLNVRKKVQQSGMKVRLGQFK
jgi:hypothetical protein